MSLTSLIVGFCFGVVCVVALLLFTTHRRVRMLDSLDFSITGPDVPRNVIDAVRQAEAVFYDDLTGWRRVVEDTQDALGLIWPQLVYRFDFSVGAFRIKAHTIHGLLEYGIEHGYLEIRSARERRLNKALPYLALQPLLNEWQAALVLQSLKERHPQLRDRSWESLAGDENAIATLYSGYMGAGGAWQLWESDLKPGAVSRYRLGFHEETQRYQRIPPQSTRP